MSEACYIFWNTYQHRNEILFETDCSHVKSFS